MMSRYKSVGVRRCKSSPGWYGEQHRHKLAAYGISTSRRRSGTQRMIGSIPIIARPVPKGQAYPLSPEEVKRRLSQLPKEDLRGIKGVEFSPPKNKFQEDSWAQYKRGDRKLMIFSQPVGKDGSLSGKDPEKVREHMKQYVIPHEVGHHKALYQAGITDKRLSLAEARADGYAFGMDVTDEDVKVFEPLHR